MQHWQGLQHWQGPRVELIALTIGVCELLSAAEFYTKNFQTELNIKLMLLVENRARANN